MGRLENRIKLGGQNIQLEEIENATASYSEVRDIATSVKIFAGRSQLIAVVCLIDSPQMTVLQEVPDRSSRLIEQRLNAIHIHAKSKLPSARFPVIWITVEELPRTVSGEVDRKAVREWLKVKVPSIPRRQMV